MLKRAADSISVLIVDDHPPLRAGLRAILENTLDVYVAGEAEDEHEATRLLQELKPKIMLLDLEMPDFSASAFEQWVRQTCPDVVTLVLTAHDRDFYLASMMDAGISGYLSKTERAENLIAAIRRAANGEVFFTVNQLDRARRWRHNVGEKWQRLTEREKQVLLLISQGRSNKAIARQLGITVKTVAFHVSTILDRLDVQSRSEAVAWLHKYMVGNLEKIPG